MSPDPMNKTPGGDTNGLLWRLVYGGLADCLRQKKSPRLLPGAPAVAVNGIGARASARASKWSSG
jgi:hypothetical protein